MTLNKLPNKDWAINILYTINQNNPIFEKHNRIEESKI